MDIMSVMPHTKLKDLREELKNPRIAQEDLARLADVRISTYRNIEQGRKVSYSKVVKVLDALNKERINQGLSEVVLDDLGVSIT
jgi:predicted transcriptional regulator